MKILNKISRNQIKSFFLIAALIGAAIFVDGHVKHDFDMENEVQALRASNTENIVKVARLEEISLKLAKENEELVSTNLKLNKALHSNVDRFIAYITVNIIVPRVYLGITKSKVKGFSLGQDSCNRMLRYEKSIFQFVTQKYKEKYFNDEQYEFLMHVILGEITAIQKECHLAIKGTI